MKKSHLCTILTAGALLLAGCGSSDKTIDAVALADSLVTDISYDDTGEVGYRYRFYLC